MDEEFELWWLIRQVRRSMFRARAKELHEIGITPGVSSALFVLSRIGQRVTPAEISRWLFQEPHSTFSMLARMEKEGLITREKDSIRKNMVRISSTERGREVFNRTAQRDSIHRVLCILSREERAQLGQILNKLWEQALAELRIRKRPPLP